MMQYFNRIRVQVLGAWTVAAAWLVHAAPAFAQGEGIAARKWAPSYFLILLCVVLGIMAVGRSSRRRERLKPEDYQAKTGAG